MSPIQLEEIGLNRYSVISIYDHCFGRDPIEGIIVVVFPLTDVPVMRRATEYTRNLF